MLDKVIDIIQDGFLYLDDVELSWLVRRLGYEIYYVPASVVYHKYNLGMDARKF